MHRIVLFIPMYNCGPQIDRVIENCNSILVNAFIECVICVDNRSTDNTVAKCKKSLENLSIEKKIIVQNDENYGLGGSHKVAIQFALEENYTHLIVLHGDDQGDINDLLQSLNKIDIDEIDCYLGARFMPGSTLVGYSIIRTVANIIFNQIFSLISGEKLYDLGSGLNLYKLSIFNDGFHLKFSDDLTFNYYLILACSQKGLKQKFFPLKWREEDQISNVKLYRQGFKIIKIIFQKIISPDKFLYREHRIHIRNEYKYKVVK